jgi:acetyltransferase-like isoleucine patch superfamily enzyme
MSRLIYHISRLLHALYKPRMLALRTNFQGERATHVRIGSSTFIDAPKNLRLGNHVYIGHFNFIEAGQGITIGEGCQITSHVTLTTHSSHDRIRYEGAAYGNLKSNVGLHEGPIEIGAFTFVGPSSVIMPGTLIGKGCIVQAHSYVRGTFADFSIIGGNPAKVLGSVQSRDEKVLAEHPELSSTYMK